MLSHSGTHQMQYQACGQAPSMHHCLPELESLVLHLSAVSHGVSTHNETCSLGCSHVGGPVMVARQQNVLPMLLFDEQIVH